MGVYVLCMVVITHADYELAKGPEECAGILTDYTRNCNMFIIFHAWYQNTFVLYIPLAWHGIFQRDNFVKFRFAVVVIDATLLSER